MRPVDLLRMALAALWRQKLRASLTLLGVIIGTTTLTLSLSVGRGVHQTIEKQFRQTDQLRRIEVFPDHNRSSEDEEDIPQEFSEVRGNMSEEKRKRIREFLLDEWRHRRHHGPPEPIGTAAMESIAQIDHVVRVTPDWHEMGRVVFNNRSLEALMTAIHAEDQSLNDLIEVGAPLSSSGADEVLIHEFLLYQLGVADDEDVEQIIGQSLRLVLQNTMSTSPDALLRMFGAQAHQLSLPEARVLDKINQLLPQALESIDLSESERALFEELLKRREPGQKPIEEKTVVGEFRIAGVYRGVTRKERESDIIMNPVLGSARIVLPLERGQDFFMQLPRVREQGIHHITVLVDDEGYVRAVNEQIKEMGYRTFALVEFAEQVKRNVSLIGLAMNIIALVALLVAALGITNTLFTSVLERTAEIGVMKAVGAKDRHIEGIFLLEGALIGIVGGLIGLLVSWISSFPGENYAQSLMAEQSHKPISTTLFVFPIWLLVSVPLFAGLITTLAALYPARRAARVQPVVALRHE